MKYRNLYNITFSDNRSDRRKRHLLFWLVVYLYHMVRIGIMMPSVSNLQNLSTLLFHSLLWGVLTSMLLTYPVTYYLVPKKFNRRKYISFITGILFLIVLIQFYGVIWKIVWDNKTMKEAIGITNEVWRSSFRPGFIRIFGNPPLVCGLFLSLKILKNWHLEQLRTETLARENTNAELQLLKAQVHPHFLFNTLNNIYSFTLNQSPLAGALVQKLSDMLHYMIHECKEPLVPLEREIKLIQDYMGLEKVRYGNRLDMQVEIKGEYKNKMIAPLLMIPFVENCFKHGASVMRGQQWIKLAIDINNNQLEFSLANSKPPQSIDITNKRGIGLANVKKRLELIYASQHELVIHETPDSYVVQLKLILNEQFVLNPKQINPVLKHEYAIT